MSPKPEHLGRWILYLAAIFTVGSLNAGSGTIDASAFGGDRTIVFAESFECENGIYGLVVENEKWSFGSSGEGSVLLNASVVRDAWNLRGAPEHESKLYRKYSNDREITDAEIKEAQVRAEYQSSKAEGKEQPKSKSEARSQ